MIQGNGVVGESLYPQYTEDKGFSVDSRNFILFGIFLPIMNS